MMVNMQDWPFSDRRKAGVPLALHIHLRRKKGHSHR